MSKKINKRAYCSNCCKNVPHFRRMSGRFQEAFGDFLRKLRIGPWYCFHCHRRTMLLRGIREDAPDYRFSRSKNRVDASKGETWSRARTAEAGPSDSNEMAAVGGDFDEGNFDVDQEQLNSLDDSPVSSDGSLSGIDPRGHESLVRGEAENEMRSDVSFAADEHSVYYVDVSSSHSIILEEPVGGRSADLQAERNGPSESDAIPEAEPVGNFIKDQSLVLKSTRINRFTEKYRDAVVARILAGKVSISSLTADGEYSEGELLSWIADKAKRQEEKIETLELNASPRWSK